MADVPQPTARHDTVEWLRQLAAGSHPVPGSAMREAADEIERLRGMMVSSIDTPAVMATPLGHLPVNGAGMRALLDEVVRLRRLHGCLHTALTLTAKSLRENADGLDQAAEDFR